MTYLFQSESPRKLSGT